MSKIMWSTVGNVANIVTIIGFAITIWQLFALKNSVKKSEQAIREVLDDKDLLIKVKSQNKKIR